MEKNNLITEEMYLFKPNKEDIKKGTNEKGSRLIYDGITELEEFEKNKIKEFKEYAKNDKIINLTDSFIYRFLQATNFDLKKTFSSIEENLLYLENVKNLQMDDEILKLLDSEICYCYGRDSKYHPIIIFNVHKIDFNKISVELIEKLFSFNIEFILKNMLIPGQIENWVLIINTGNINLFSIPMTKIKKCLAFLQNNYRSRAYKSYVVNTSWSVSCVWKIVKGFLEKNTIEKVRLSSDNYHKEMIESINKDQLEIKYGGNLPNKEKDFWPPSVNNNNYKIENCKNQYFTKEEYKNIYKNRNESYVNKDLI